jgi:hypothetical protein
MKLSYTPEERRALAAAVARDETLVCPSCGARLARHDVGTPPAMPYVRHRVLLVCPGCGRSAAVDTGRKPGR